MGSDGVELMTIFTIGCEMIGEYRDRQDLLKADKWAGI